MDWKIKTYNRPNKFKYTGAKNPYNADFWIVRGFPQLIENGACLR